MKRRSIRLKKLALVGTETLMGDVIDHPLRHQTPASFDRLQVEGP